MNNFCTDVIKKLSQITSLDLDHFYNDESMPEDNSSAFHYPSLLVFEVPYYELCNNQDGVDFKNEIRVNRQFSLEIVSKTIDDLIEIEEKLFQGLSTPTTMSTETCDNTNQQPIISLENKDKIERNHREREDIYISFIEIKVSNLLLKKEIIHPVKIELDKSLQSRIMQHLCVLNEALVQLQDNINNLSGQIEANQGNNVETDNSDDSLSSRHNKLLEEYSDLQNQINEMYTFDNLCHEKLLAEDKDFMFCYLEMMENEVSLVDATETLKKKKEKERKEEENRIKEEEENKRNRESLAERNRRIIQSKGDIVLNHYTDAIVKEIKSTFADQLSIPVYGGSTFYFSKYIDSNIDLPDIGFEVPKSYIIIESSLEFVFGIKQYCTYNSDGIEILHDFSMEALPIDFSFYSRIHADDPKIFALLRSKMIELYGDGNTITISDLTYENEYVKLLVQTHEKYLSPGYWDDLEDRNQTGMILRFTNQNLVFYPHCIEKSDIEYNPLLQLDLVKQTQYFELCASKMNIARNKLKTDYKEVRNPPPRGLISKALNAAIKTQDFRKLQNMFATNQPIDHPLFNKVFNEITEIYPLWDRMCFGWSIERIDDDMEELETSFTEKYKELRGLVGIPLLFDNGKYFDIPACEVIIKYLTKFSFRRNYNHNTFIDGFLSSPESSHMVLVSDSIPVIDEYLLEKKKQSELQAQREAERRRREAEQRRLEEEWRQESGYYDRPSRETRDSSSSQSLGDWVDKTFGLEKNPDLAGSAGCMMNKTGYCDPRCKLHRACSRRSKYK